MSAAEPIQVQCLMVDSGFSVRPRTWGAFSFTRLAANGNAVVTLFNQLETGIHDEL
jgi:hypothetical protein